MVVRVSKEKRINRHKRPQAPAKPILMGGQNYSATYETLAELVTEKTLAKQQNRSMSAAWDDTEALNIPGSQRGSHSGLSDAERKEVLYQAYMNIPWVSAAIDATTKRLTSGGLAIEEIKKGEGVQAHADLLTEFFGTTNEEWDFLQFIRSVADDIQIYGEAYAEIVWKGNVPATIYKIDCATMSYNLAPSGKVLSYTQQMSNSRETNTFDPKDIIRWWLPSKRANMVAESPIERLLNTISAEQNMVTWTQSFFRKGSKPPYWIKTEGTEDDAKRFVKYLKENYTGVKNANAPIVTYGSAELKEYGKGLIDIDFPTGRKMTRDEVLAVMGVPPAMVSLIESGNLGSGSGTSQSKQFLYNTVQPLHHMIFEKLNFRIVRQGFKINDYKILTHFADYRDDEEIVKVQDSHIKNGISTQNEERTAMGKEAYKGYGDTPVLFSGKEILPLDRLDQLSDEQQQSAQLDIETKKTQVEGMKQTQQQQQDNHQQQRGEPQPPNQQPPQKGGQDTKKKKVATAHDAKKGEHASE